MSRLRRLSLFAVIVTVFAVTAVVAVTLQRQDGSQPAVSIAVLPGLTGQAQDAPAPDGSNAGLPAAIAAVLAASEGDPIDDQGADKDSAAQPESDGGITVTVAPAPAVAAGRTDQMRIRIPAMGVNASMVDVGFNAAGQLDIPWDGAVVAWYTISALPGEPGNALLGAHVDWRGSTAVFWRLRDLTEGDLIYIDTPTGELVYRVASAGLVSNDTPLGDVLGAREGPQSITLFTCGGTFDQAAQDYDQRFIVRAVAVPALTQALD